MQHAHGCGADAAAAAAAAATVAPLLQLKRAAEKAQELARFSRALELRERALAAAALALPRDSLIISALLSEQYKTHFHASGADFDSPASVEMVELRRSLPLLHARWQAGTLFLPTAEDVAFLMADEWPGLPAQMCGAFFYICAAALVAKQRCLAPRTPADISVRARELYGALRAALETDARGMLERDLRTGQAWSALTTAHASVVVSAIKMHIHMLVLAALSNEAGVLQRMRTACGLTAAEETALRQLAERHEAGGGQTQKSGGAKTVGRLDCHTSTGCCCRRGAPRAAPLRAAELRRARGAPLKLFKLCGRAGNAHEGAEPYSGQRNVYEAVRL
jgi:hypothetical protein